MTLIFNGVMQSPTALPGFWIFMYRVSPLTYWVGGMANAMLYGRPIQCAEDEMSIFPPPNGQTCQQYLAPYLTEAPGKLLNPQSTTECHYCSLRSANQFLDGVNIHWLDRWQDFGLMWVYIAFNVGGAVFLYWFFRVRKTSGKKSFSFRGKMAAMASAIAEDIRCGYKAKERTNKRNAQVF